MIYRTSDGETLDFIVWRTYGKTAGILEHVLTANRHLAEYGAVLPAGLEINLPTIAEPKNKQKIKMWQ